MGWRARKKEPISERERQLQREIKQLEDQIQALSARGPRQSEVPGATVPRPTASPAPAAPTAPVPVDPPHSSTPIAPGQPRFRSTALPGGQGTPRPDPGTSAQPSEQVFERVDLKRLEAPPEAASKALYNELGVRKYDLPGAWQRFKALFQGASAQNQTLVRLLAAGNIQGLRPLRYEKRVARRRFIMFALLLFLLLWGIVAVFLRR